LSVASGGGETDTATRVHGDAAKKGDGKK